LLNPVKAMLSYHQNCLYFNLSVKDTWLLAEHRCKLLSSKFVRSDCLVRW